MQASPLRPLAKELGTTDRTLRRAIEIGLVRADRPSPRKVQIGPEERVYLRSYWETLSRLREALRTEPSVRAAVLFGSVARGDSHDDSDVDLLVDLTESAPGAWVDVRRRLEDATGRRIQFVPVDSAKKSPSLLSEILNEGRPLVDREQLWPSLQASRRSVERAARAKTRERATALSELSAPKAAG